MQTKESIYAYLEKMFVDLFEIDKGLIHPHARLYEDLDIDSIDAIDMVIKLRNMTGKNIQPAMFKQVRTVQEVVDGIYQLLHEEIDKGPDT